MYLGSLTHLARNLGKAKWRMHCCRTAPRTSPGRVCRGQLVEQSLQWWQSQMSGSLRRRSFIPHRAQAISFLREGMEVRREWAGGGAVPALHALLE